MTPAYSGEYQTFGIRPERRAKRKLSGPEVRLGDTENRTRFDFHHRRFCTIAGQDRSFLQNRLTGYAPAESESWPPHRKTRPRSSMCAAFRDSRRDFSFDAHPVLLAVCCPCFFHRACFVRPESGEACSLVRPAD